ncbi:hypothetical protein L7F22_051720 [Adiantum nelumboides]|nr:hypothetical protein [Adiantum nelumboides]
MKDGGKCCDEEMHEAATRSFQGMSNEVQLNKLDEDKDTTTGAHKGVNDRREESDHEVGVDDENSLSENKDEDKDPIIEDPKVDTGGNKVSKKEDPKVDTGVSKELLEECLPADEEVHKVQFLGDKDPPIGVDVNEHTQGLKASWLDEPTVIERNPPEDIPVSKGKLIILDVNGVVLKAKREKEKGKHEQKQATLVAEISQVQEELKQHKEKNASIAEPNKSPRKASSGGSVLVDKVLEPLDAALEAYEARLKPKKTQEERQMTYPHSEVEVGRLKMCKKLVKTAQAMMEPKPLIPPPETKPKKVGFETPKAKVFEASTQTNVEPKSQKDVQAKTVAQTNSVETQRDNQVVANTTDDARSQYMAPIPEIEEPWPNELWEAIRSAKDGSATFQSVPIIEVNTGHEVYQGDIQSLYGDAGTEVSIESKTESLNTLLSYVGEHETRSKTRVVSSQRKAISKMMDTKSMHELMSAPIQCTITLSELLKIRQHVWDEVGKNLEKRGLKIPLQELPSNERSSKTQQEDATAKFVPINKVEEYCDGEEGDTTLPVKYKGIKMLAILDSGAGVAIATKNIHPSASHLVMRLALELADKSYGLSASSIANRIIIRFADGCCEGSHCNFTQSKPLKPQREPSEHPLASRMVSRLTLELAGKSYGLPTSSNASRMVIRLVDGCSEDPRCNFTQSKELKMQRGPSDYPSAVRLVMRRVLELANKSYDLPASSNANHITIRLTNDCLEGPRCDFT